MRIFWSSLELWRPIIDRFRLIYPFFFYEFLCFSPQRRRPRQRLRPRLLRLNDDGDYDVVDGDDCDNGYDHDCCGSTTTAITTLTMVTIAATWWLQPRLRQLGDYDHGNGYDHDCCGSTTMAITTLAMVTIAAAMATIATPKSVGRWLSLEGSERHHFHALGPPSLQPR